MSRLTSYDVDFLHIGSHPQKQNIDSVISNGLVATPKLVPCIFEKLISFTWSIRVGKKYFFQWWIQSLSEADIPVWAPKLGAQIKIELM